MSTNYVTYCRECSGNYFLNDVVSCKSCINGTSDNSFIIQKKIQKQTGVESSTYINNLVPYEVTKNQKNYKYHKNNISKLAKNNSDRLYSSNSMSSQSLYSINRNTSSLKASKTSLKPGSLAPGGIGVDSKHASYDRHLAKLKAKSLKPRESSQVTKPIQGNKVNNISLFNYSSYNSNKCSINCVN
jgi:hypothetical protein